MRVGDDQQEGDAGGADERTHERREQFGGPDQLQVTWLVSTLGVRADDAERKNKKQ